jgi:hypothetical protein
MKKTQSALTQMAQVDIKAIAVYVAAAMALGCISFGAHADSSAAARRALLPKYQQECGSCHVAYPPGMLPTASWQRVIASLSKHYGVDASLDAASAREISVWVAAHAGTQRRTNEEPAQDRITQSAWFKRKHRDGEVPAGAWKRASIGSPSNCAACHAGAESGNFNEDDVRIPK